MDGVVVAFTVGLMFLCAIFAGMMSLLSMEGDQILPSLQEGARSHSAGPRRVRLRKWLLSLEVGLTVVLLIGAGGPVKTSQRVPAGGLRPMPKNVADVPPTLPLTKTHLLAPCATF